MLRFGLVFAALSTLSACVTPGNSLYGSRTQEVIPPSISQVLAPSEVGTCADARCYMDLAKTQLSYGNRFEQDSARVAFAATHILLDEETEALDILSNIKIKKFEQIFYKNFGQIEKNKINKFIIDTQRWENVDLPLPESLIGRNEEYDTLYAFLLALNGEIDAANALSKGFKDKGNRDKVLFLLCLKALDSKEYGAAQNFAKELAPAGRNKQARSKAFTIIHNKLYQEGLKAEAFESLQALNFQSDKDAAHAGIAIALAGDEQLEAALTLVDKIITSFPRKLAYEGILHLYAERGDLDQIRYIIGELPYNYRDDLSYVKLVANFAKSGHLDEAEDLLAEIPNDKETIYSLSQLGKVTGEMSYFQQAMVLASERQKQEGHKVIQGLVFLSSDLAHAGYFSESIKTLHMYKIPPLRKLVRELVFSSAFNSPNKPIQYEDIMQIAEQDMKLSRSEEYGQILKNATKLMLVNRASLEGIDRYLKATEQVSNTFLREELQGQIIPALAYLGEFDRVNKLVSGMTHTMPRILALLRLSRFHIFKDKIETI
ncbi:tetratricopeptide repeat protein [Sneathiella limimaris]|uniref:tetratricopeptide repeat protein n=1 Tax=Sneathiella limimaris TaxID=1964213 RepID=UPI00146A2A96|nr:hypothetical protein [Sneathiella limimaris]